MFPDFTIFHGFHVGLMLLVIIPFLICHLQALSAIIGVGFIFVHLILYCGQQLKAHCKIK